MKVIFFGTPAFAVPPLTALIAASDIDVEAVVSQPDRRRGRGKQLSPSPIKALALEHQIPVWQPEKVKRCPDTLAKLRQSAADVFVVVAYGQILSSEILSMPRLGCVNVHGSLLPKYRGAAPLQWAIANGETETGITTMLMDEGMDTGAMLLKQTTPIDPLENFFELGDRLATLGANLLVDTLRKLEQGGLQPMPQNDDDATYAPLLKKSDFELDWQQTALQLHNQVRGFYPNGFRPQQQQTLKILSTIPLGASTQAFLAQQSDWQPLWETFQNTAIAPGDPGQVVAILKQWGPVVQTGKDYLLLKTVQPPGKRPQSGADFANGSRLQIGDRL